MTAPRVALISLDAWDQVWRRNQHLAAALVGSGAISSLVFVDPPAPGLALRARRHTPADGITVVAPPLVVPRSYGGHRLIGRWMQRRVRDVDVLWINDPVASIAAMRSAPAAVYDVTDDWRAMPQTDRGRARVIAAEDELASRRVPTVVCSDVLAQRWQDRYGMTPTLIPNAVDISAVRAAERRPLPGRAPHAVYVGTLHENRIDTALVEQLAGDWPGTVHLVGPVGFSATVRERLEDRAVRLPGAVPSADVPGWLVSADALICPHVVSDFTLSLDAIKAHEYLATDRPIVATPTSGFQALSADGLAVAAPGEFVDAAVSALGTGPFTRSAPPAWGDRAAQFAAVLRSAVRA